MLSIPRLLVSVRNTSEALLAANSGVDLIDFKEPAQGPLGMVSRKILNESVNAVVSQFPNPIISIACGEVREELTERSYPLPHVSYYKLGLSGLKKRSNWIQLWKERREELESAQEHQHERDSRWIAVAYVDSESAESPAIEEVLDAAIETGCAGLLLDTFFKGDKRLFDFVSPLKVKALVENARQADLLVAVAGRLRVEDIPAVLSTGADILGVRSAVCEQQDRRGSLSAKAIQTFRDTMEQFHF